MLKGIGLADSHQQFEYLCALEASNQISAQERSLLREHLKSCAECQEALSEYGTLADALTQRSKAHSTTPLPPGMYARFRARAFNDGVRLPRDPEEEYEGTASLSPPLWRNLWLWAAAAAVAAALILVLFVRRPAVQHATQTSRITTTPASPEQRSESEIALQKALAGLQARENEVETELRNQQRAAKAAEINEAAVNSSITALKVENEEAHKSELQAKANIQRLETQLAQAQADRTEARNALALRAAEIAELKIRVAGLDAELSHGHRLSASLEEMRDLIQNRDVRLIKLGGVNEGKEERAFGRAFYIPGQKLVLFAYDLRDPKSLTAQSFYVWGDKPGTNQPVQSLGKLTLDDQKDNRWAIRVESPDLFARINEIFITTESSKGTVEKPTGQPMLVTSLTKTRP